jgi:hypothetical protein
MATCHTVPMRRVVHLLAAACLATPTTLATTCAGHAHAAAPATAATVTYAGESVCTIDDHRAIELSGLVSTASGYVAINDGQHDGSDIRIFYLDQRCRVTRTLSHPTLARDPEDLAVAPDGTLWVGDIGDNLTGETRRQTIALWRIPGGDGKPVIYRLTYPDGPHDAEALLFTGDGRPLIITKELGPALLYQPVAPIKVGGTVAMEKVGTFTPPVVSVDNPLGAIGESMVTGAAISPNRDRVAVRTYTAAFEWDVPDGDVVKAITTGRPRRTGLSDEPQGEAIAYTVDGSEFLTMSDESGPTILRRYTRSTELAATTAATTNATAAGSADPSVAALAGSQPGWPVPIAWAGLIVAGEGLLVALLGILGLRRSRRSAEDLGRLR